MDFKKNHLYIYIYMIFLHINIYKNIYIYTPVLEQLLCFGLVARLGSVLQGVQKVLLLLLGVQSQALGRVSLGLGCLLCLGFLFLCLGLILFDLWGHGT